MFRISSAVLTLALAGAPFLSLAHAQQPNQAEEEGLTSPNVVESQGAQPTDQGNRAPDVLDQEDKPTLYGALSRLRQAPPSLEGEPVPRPNAFASEPAKEMQPAQAEEISLFPENYIE